MPDLSDAIRKGKQLRSIGFDDAPFKRGENIPVNISGIVCNEGMFEGMLWGQVQQDGEDATEVVSQMVLSSKFHAQLHAVLIDGIAFGGFNILNLPQLNQNLGLACIAVMRKQPDLNAIDLAIQNLSNYEVKKQKLIAAGTIHQSEHHVFQVSGATKEDAVTLLDRISVNGKVPEPLRLAHLIGSAIKTGESSNRA